jgi:CTP:molybdopterin cytidylyltransferase MocA
MKGGARPVLRIVVLAAGFSTRLGSPKALVRIHGVPLLRRTLGVLRPFAAPREIIVVVPPGAGRYRIAAAGIPAEFVPNPGRASGMSSSVLAGLRRARHSAGVLVLPVDLAGLAVRDIARLIRRWRVSRRKVVARGVDGGPASPLVLPHWLYPRAEELRGDRGLRDLVRRLPGSAVCLVAMPSAAPDVDTPADLERARRRVRPAPAGPKSPG